MTGKDLIMYILQNDLENEVIFNNGACVYLMTEQEAAARFEVGVETVRIWYAFGMIRGLKLGDEVYYLRNQVDPRANLERSNNEHNCK